MTCALCTWAKWPAKPVADLPPRRTAMKALALPLLARQRRAGAAALLCAGLGLAMPLCAETSITLTPEERLQAIRLGLVQTALQGATEVQAGAWIDGQGALQQASTFRSGMQVRGVQVLSYQRDASGQPQAELKVAHKQDLVKTPEAAAHKPSPAANAAKSAAPVCANGEVPGASGRLRHLLGVQVESVGPWAVDDRPAMADAAHGLLNHWLQASQAAASWRMLEQAAAHSGSAYERFLTGAGNEMLVPWNARVRISPASGGAVNSMLGSALPSALAWAGLQPLRALPVQVHFTVQAPGQSAIGWQASAELVLHAEPQRWGPYRLSSGSQAALSALVQGWAKTLSVRLACEPLRPEVLHVQGKNLQINAGSLAGVRAGDEWLLADRQRFPGQLLDPGVAGQTVLARVQQVSPLQASLQVVAGPAASVQARWQAWPSESPGQ